MMPISSEQAAARTARMDAELATLLQIPAKPGQPQTRPVDTAEPGDLRGFLLALGLVCGLIALVGFSVLPDY